MKQTYMLDTNVCALILRERPTELLQLLQAHVEKRHKIVISAITYAELRFAQPGLDNPAIDGFLERIDSVLPWDAGAVEATANIKHHLGERADSIGRNDTMIAGHAVSENCVLITNLRDVFACVPGLAYDDWLAN